MGELKTLKVCLDSELPELLDRDYNTLYYLYNKLVLFFGQTIYNDPYAIVESIPKNPISGMLYFDLSDGKVKGYIDSSITDIAEVENEEQLEILKETGTSFMLNSNRRYLDFQRRIITLPYQNGTYELSVSLANNLKLDEDTVLAYNPETGEFDVSGKYEDYDLVFTKSYRGLDSNSVETDVSRHSVSSNLKISSEYGNILNMIDNGLYGHIDNTITREEFEYITEKFKKYHDFISDYYDELIEKIEASEDLITEDTISKRILSALEETFPEFQENLDKFNEYAAKLEPLEKRCNEYTDNKFEEAVGVITEKIRVVANDMWEIFGEEEEPEPTPTPDPEEGDMIVTDIKTSSIPGNIDVTRKRIKKEDTSTESQDITP